MTPQAQNAKNLKIFRQKKAPRKGLFSRAAGGMLLLTGENNRFSMILLPVIY